MNYNEIVSALRVAARDVLRMQKVNSLRDQMLEVQNRLDSISKSFEGFSANTAERLAVVAYDMSRLEDANPRKAKLQEQYEGLTKDLTADLEMSRQAYEKEAEGLKKALAEVQERIDKVQSGESKVSAECLSAQVSRMIESVVDASVRENLAGALTAPVEGSER